MFNVILLLLGSCILTTRATVSDFISVSNEFQFFPALMTAFSKPSPGDLSTVYYGAKGFTSLNESLPKVVKLDVCAHVHKNFNDNINPESIFHAVSTWSLFHCASPNVLNIQEKKLHTDNTIKVLQAVLQSDKSTSADIRFALETLKLIGESFANAIKTKQLLQARAKEDDSFQNVGHILHAAALLGTHGQFAVQHVEDLMVQVDEIDGRMLQWEGGLTMTSLLLTGVLRLQGTKPFSQTQADKFANYLLSRKSVQNPKGIIALFEATWALSKSAVSPVTITFIESSQVTTDKPELKIRVSNLLGEPLEPPLSPVIAQSATRIADDVVVLSKQVLSAGSNPSEYILPLNLDPGQYRVGITAGSHSAALVVRVLGPVKIQWLEVGLGDADGSSAARLTKLQYPDKLPTVLQADSSQHFVVRFSLSRPVHQPFLRLSSSKREIIFVAEQDANKIYKIDTNLASELSYSATFQIELILGDWVMSNPVRWSCGEIEIELSTINQNRSLPRGPQFEIKHMFRPAEKRPPHVVSMLFTALAVAPLLLLIILWFKLGTNMNNFTISALSFHAGLAGIFGLFVLFWLKLDMFTTCGWLIPLGGLTFLAGHHVLSKLANKRK